MPTDTPEAFGRRLDGLSAQFSDAGLRKLLTELGQDAKVDAAVGFRQDLGGDLAMRNWRRKAPQKLTARYDITGPSTMEVTPERRARGPISMLESGRKPRRAGGVIPGRIRTTKDGTQSQRISFAKRTVGPMAPKGTWSDGYEVIARRFPARLKDHASRMIRKGIGG